MLSNTIALTLAVLAFANTASASRFSRAETDIATPTDFQFLALDPYEALDLRLSISDTRNKVLDSYKNARNRSPCHTVASAALERGCSTLETPTRVEGDSVVGAEQIISNTIKAYAASLAICELQEAKSKIPRACDASVPNEHSKVKPSQKQLDECVTALKSEPQSWTSYSNSKQNVFYICHALSASVRKEEALDIIEEYIKNAAELGDQLLHAPQQAQALFDEVKTNIMHFWNELQHHDAAQRQNMDMHWTQLKSGMEADLSGIIRQFRNELEELQTKGHQEIQEQWNHAQASFSKASDRVSALVTKQEESAYGQVELYKYAVALFQQGIVQAMGNATRGLALENELMESSYQSLLQFGVALADMVLKVDGVEARMVALETGMRAIYTETEKRFAALHIKANETEETLDRVLDKALGLQGVIEPILHFLSIGWSEGLGTLATFIALNIVYALLLYGVWERWAGFSIIGSVLAATASALVLSFTTLAHLAPAYRYLLDKASDLLAMDVRVDLSLVIAAGLFISAICFCFYVWIARQRRRRRRAPYDPASPPMPKWRV